MTDHVRFEIRFRRWYDVKIYRAIVEVTYKSENVIRFLITAGEKRMWMEKHLFKKKGQWKMTRVDFNMHGSTKDNAVMLMNIQDAIDYQLRKIYSE